MKKSYRNLMFETLFAGSCIVSGLFLIATGANSVRKVLS